jgi:hypothetical protein
MKFLWAGSELLVIERQNNELVTQITTIVFASANVGAYTETETGEIEIEIASFSLGRFEVHENTIAASHRRLQSPGTSIIYYRNPRIPPFATIQDKGWSVNALSIPVSGIKALSLCPIRGGKRILPAESIPVIDMKSDRHKLAPEPWIVDEPAQRRLSGRTTAAALGGEKFEQLNFFWSRFENDIVGAQYSAKEEG